MIHLFYTKFDRPLEDGQWRDYLNALPSGICEKSKGYRKWQDQHAYIFGKLLLLQGLNKIGFDRKKIGELQYNRYGKPFFNENLDFNISHSGQQVICAIGTNVKLGIDIEIRRKIELSDFDLAMTESQWHLISNSNDPVKTFFRLWTIKESIIKAEGKGLSIPLQGIHIFKNQGQYNKKIWFLNELSPDEDTFTCLATNININKTELNFVETNFYS